ncbi:hypothetical protein T06_5377 [Trichinella sp. T6]|nr:hypothetical protein T06_5377 [Trichinella sp. T6]
MGYEPHSMFYKMHKYINWEELQPAKMFNNVCAKNMRIICLDKISKMIAEFFGEINKISSKFYFYSKLSMNT